MAGGDVELCGFLDAKLPGGRGMSQRVKKRSLAPWKVWRRHWCSVRKLGPGLGVEIQLDCGISTNGGSVVHNDGKNSIKVPFDSILCRTESRTKQFAFGIFPPKERKPLLYLCSTSETETQRWMANLRHLLKPRKHRFMEGTFNMSMVDNTHSRAAGLTGLHGDLVASRSGVFIKDVSTGDIVENFEWKEMSQFHLSTSGRPEDVKRICVIHTTKEFRNGIGELHIFCLNAAKLLQDLVTQGRGPRLRHVTQRPLSLSEGDLRLSIHNDVDFGNFPVLKSKVASSLINAGLGILLSSRSGSEAKLINEMAESHCTEKIKLSYIVRAHAVENVYQPEPESAPNINSSLEELEEGSSPRRVSNISTASGIYEEIIETLPTNSFDIRIHSNIYEVPEDLILKNSNFREKPPPLPPRKLCGSTATRNESLSDDGLDSEGGTRSVTPCTQDERTPEDKVSPGTREIFENTDYVPMSPRLKDLALQHLQTKKATQEEVYMVMR
ncbi:uncharacterized protein [Venturia canescens]|nr:uncharacterized protein LOC122407306 isoform X2 [Venturia canescens]XP_043269649.1 uncharacterized protein LOC122407306 isoform X2 [Venturia canescens]